MGGYGCLTRRHQGNRAKRTDCASHKHISGRTKIQTTSIERRGASVVLVDPTWRLYKHGRRCHHTATASPPWRSAKTRSQSQATNLIIRWIRTGRTRTRGTCAPRRLCASSLECLPCQPSLHAAVQAHMLTGHQLYFWFFHSCDGFQNCTGVTASFRSDCLPKMVRLSHRM